MESGDEHMGHMGLGFSPAEHTVLHPKCPARAVSHSMGHRGDFPPPQSAFICQDIPGRWKFSTQDSRLPVTKS